MRMIGVAAMLAGALAGAAAAEPLGVSEADETAIRQVVTDLEEAWAAGDGQAWGAVFAEDADFTVWFGLRMTGRQAIAEGHQYIFGGFYAGTLFDMEVQAIRLIGPDTALVHLDGWVMNAGEARPDTPPFAAPLAVMVRAGDGWLIEAFQNTPSLLGTDEQHGDIRALQPAEGG